MLTYLGVKIVEGAWRNSPTQDLIESLGTAAALDGQRVRALFPLTVLLPLHLRPQGNWVHAKASTACPSCITEGQPWRLEWRFAWTMLCPTHEQFLADTCPSCQLPIRAKVPLNVPNVCGNLVARNACGQRLDQLPPTATVDNDRLLETQQNLSNSTHALAYRNPEPAKKVLLAFMRTTRHESVADDVPDHLHDVTAAWLAERTRYRRFTPPPLVAAGLFLSRQPT